MILEFINSDGTFYKNICFIGIIMKCYTNGIYDPTVSIKNASKTHKVIWRFKND